jgi:hypothetical protein
MKKLLLFFLFISSVIYAQPLIVQPPNIIECIVLEGTELTHFDLTSNNEIILNNLDPLLFGIIFFENQNDAENNTNPIINPTDYGIGWLLDKLIYVKVTELVNPTSYAITFFGIEKKSISAGFPNDLQVYESQFDNVAAFNLTLNEITIRDGYDSVNASVQYYPSLEDATNNTNTIANPTTYTNLQNNQIIGVRLTSNIYGCYSVRYFKIVVVDVENIISIPNVTFKNKLLMSSTNDFIALNENNSKIKVDINNDGEIQSYEASLIYYLYVEGTATINFEGIQFFPNLKELWSDNSLATSITIPSTSTIERFYCQQCNELANLNIIGLSQLEYLTITFAPLNTVDLTGCSSLFALDLYECPTNNINVSNLSNLSWVSFHNGNLTSLDISNNYYLQGLDITGNDFTELDFSNKPFFYDLKCTNNPNLSFVNLKNSKVQSATSQIFSGNPNLMFVCCDDSELNTIQNIAEAEGNISVNFNSYCSFTPGGNFNTISGTMIFDENNNGCDAIDLPQPNIKININDGTNQGATFTNNLGNYSFFTQTGNFSLTPNVENPSWFNFSPTTATIPFANNNDNVVNQNFCITANGIHPDLEIVIVPIIPARPGFDAVYKIVYKNKGNQVVTRTINFTYNESVLDFVSSSLVPNNSGSGFMNWTVPNIAPFQSGSILVTFNVNSPQETPAVNIGDVLDFNANIDVTADDVIADNNFDFNQTVVGSYDPNDITCLEGNALPLADIGTYLHYNIRFENTGTAPAENIVVKSEIDLAQYNIQSLQIMESSHPMEVKVTGNIAEFIFQTINLDTGGHGNILLKLKSNAAMTYNQVVNSADIFFDYNFPIETNDEQTVFADLSKDDFNKDLSIQIYPNPAAHIITVKADGTINAVQLFDAQGRLLFTKLINENTTEIDLSIYSSGIYFINVSTLTGKQTRKIIKK